MPTKDEISKALNEHVKPKLENVPCSVCGKIQWVIPDTIFELREFFGGGVKIGGGAQVLPMAVVACHNCGHSILFNAINIGAIRIAK